MAVSQYPPYDVALEDDCTWLCVTRNWSSVSKDSAVKKEREKAVRVGKEILHHLSNRLTETGTKSPLGAKYQEMACTNLKDVAYNHQHTIGYWSFMRKAGRVVGEGKAKPAGWQVNSLFGELAHSLIDEGGALHNTNFAKMVAVSLSPKDDGGREDFMHEFRIYFATVYYELAARKILEALISNYGINKASARCDLYDELGIGRLMANGKRDHRMSDEIWTMGPPLITEVKIAALKDDYLELVKARRNEADRQKAGTSSRKTRTSGNNQRPKKRARTSTPESEEDEDEKHNSRAASTSAVVVIGLPNNDAGSDVDELASSPQSALRKTVKGSGRIVQRTAPASALARSRAADLGRRVKGSGAVVLYPNGSAEAERLIEQELQAKAAVRAQEEEDDDEGDGPDSEEELHSW